MDWNYFSIIEHKLEIFRNFSKFSLLYLHAELKTAVTIKHRI